MWPILMLDRMGVAKTFLAHSCISSHIYLLYMCMYVHTYQSKLYTHTHTIPLESVESFYTNETILLQYFTVHSTIQCPSCAPVPIEEEQPKILPLHLTVNMIFLESYEKSFLWTSLKVFTPKKFYLSC